MIRQVVLDTETTGLSWERGNRVVEIGAIEIIERRPTGRRFQRYLNPDREMEPGAQEITGLSWTFLADKPRFVQVVDEFLDFIRDAELVIHNASFDIGFLDYELSLAGLQHGKMTDHAQVLDTLTMARERFPGQRNSLDALCRRLGVDNAHRKLHGALLDAELLTEVYLSLTAGQGALGLNHAEAAPPTGGESFTTSTLPTQRPRLLLANADEQAAHLTRLAKIAGKAGRVLWSPEEIK
jgi:DNA polymerase-3 subunit epsilon